MSKDQVSRFSKGGVVVVLGTADLGTADLGTADLAPVSQPAATCVSPGHRGDLQAETAHP